MLKIRFATPEDRIAISVLVVHSFGQNNEYRMIDSLRETGHITTELVAVLDDRVIGYICFSKLDAPEEWWVLAPVCVAQDHQRKGIGGELVRYGLDQARQAHAKAVVVVGNPDYYHRFGFVFEGAAQIVTPFPLQYTGLFPIAAETAAAQVILRYPDAFSKV